jgi:hypothetical protein
MRALRLCVVLWSLFPALSLRAQDKSSTNVHGTPRPELNEGSPVRIARLSFSSAPGVDSSEQDQIASLVENQNCPANELQSCVAGLIRDAFYQHGYMEAEVQLPRMSFSRVDQSETAESDRPRS